MKKVLVMVLSCEQPPYNHMIQTSIRTWDSVYIDNVKSIFYCGNSGIADTDKIKHFPVEEGLFMMGYKDLLAYEWALKNEDFDYVARINSSCFVDKVSLLNHCQTLPCSGVFQGVVAPLPSGRLFCWGGAQYIISKDVLQKLVDNKHLWDHSQMEDVAMSCVAAEVGVSYSHGNACALHYKDDGYIAFWYNKGLGGGELFKTLSEMENFESLKHQYFYRIKQDTERHLDEVFMNDLYNLKNDKYNRD